MAPHGTPDSVNRPHAYSATPAGENGGMQRENSPELLRWRADILMDEMMLGAVDVTAGQTGGLATDVDLVRPSPASSPSPQQTASPAANEPAPAPDNLDDAAEESDSWWRSPFAVEPPRPDDIPPYSVASNAHLSNWASSGGVTETDSAFSTQPTPAAETVTPETPPSADGGVLRPPTVMRSPEDQAQTEGARASMASRTRPETASFETAAQRARRTNLLPRMSSVEAGALLREIAEMREEIGGVVPESHEWSVRSRHLLDKAETILRHAPERSAEVEYYLNQVRAILSSVRQTWRWSQAYYRQLRLYLSAWIAFATITLTGSLLFRPQLAEVATLLFGLSTRSFSAQIFGLWLAAPAAGALGGALGALLNMRRYRQTDHGFLDRKYSLRGLILPIMGAIVGLIFFAPFALILYLLTPGGALAWGLALLPVALAFVYGYFQESLYGTQV